MLKKLSDGVLRRFRREEKRDAHYDKKLFARLRNEDPHYIELITYLARYAQTIAQKAPEKAYEVSIVHLLVCYRMLEIAATHEAGDAADDRYQKQALKNLDEILPQEKQIDAQEIAALLISKHMHMGKK